MAGGKLSPRQKMIGMMYLVLTALLAMNVSKDILDAFVTVNDGLEKTKHNFKEKNNDQYDAFVASFNENQTKVGPYWKKAQEVQKTANEIVSHIDLIKVEIIGGIEPTIPKDKIMGKNQLGEDTIVNLKHVKVKDNYLFPTNLLIGGDAVNPKTGPMSAIELKEKLEAYRDQLLTIVNDDKSAIAQALKETFSFDVRENAAGVVENWASYNFYGVPSAATITILTKIQTDVRNAESDVIKYLYSSVDAASFKFNKLEAAVISPSNYVITGDTFRAEVFLAAFDSTQNPIVSIGDKIDSTTNQVVGDSVELEVKDGKGYLKIPAKSNGDFAYEGVIRIKNPATKKLDPYFFNFDYKVASPSTTISATKMNVFYIGVDNPVDISASGVAKDKIQASISNGSIVKKSDGWVVRPSKVGTAKVSVNAEVQGERKSMGSMDFRVKQIPKPEASIGGKSGGNIKGAALKAASGIRAAMDNFDFEVSVVVSSFKMGYVASNGLLEEVSVNGNSFNSEVKTKLGSLKRNSKVFFEDIKVKMPDGRTVTLAPVNFKVI
ncbi:MAG: hypothetical protein CMO34_01340 [Verrucomicrobia bacterium]|nr:hypothetical protein [Verrucomicrobiota bacterium]